MSSSGLGDSSEVVGEGVFSFRWKELSLENEGERAIGCKLVARDVVVSRREGAIAEPDSVPEWVVRMGTVACARHTSKCPVDATLANLDAIEARFKAPDQLDLSALAHIASTVCGGLINCNPQPNRR
jgi:hypothetical protein